MSLRPALVHSCHDQNKVFQFMEPFLSIVPDKKQLMELWDQAAEQLGEVRPKNCRCSYRVSLQEAELLVKNGIADYLIIDWRYNEEKKTFFPAPNNNLVWGGKQAEDLGLIKASYAAKTPRVMTIEKANIERAYVDNKKDEIERIEEWGRLQHLLWCELTTVYPDFWECPFRGRAMLPLIGFDQRTKSKNIS